VAAISILDELRSDLGLVLWRSARNVLLWAETPPASRDELFADEAACGRVELLAQVDADAELRAPLLVIADLLANPERADLLRVVNACRRMALWAEQRGALATALEFTQAAALAAPDSASLAFSVGRLARRRAEYDRAESWYTRAVVQAREHGDWRSYASALAGIGNLHVQKGNYPAAKRVHLRCLHAASRHRVQDLVAAAYHNLFSIEVEMQAGMEADVLAARALEAYAGAVPSIHFLAHDVAHHWNLTGRYAGALEIAAALEPVAPVSGISPLVQSLIARSAGGLGDRARFEVAAAHIDELLSDPAVPEDTAARTLLGLAHGAFNLGEARSAAAYAEEAMSIARKRAEGRVALEAESLMEAASKLSGMRSPARKEKRVPVPELADDFVRALSSGAALAGV
jgi:tetratricopeptide (TPR) repeat protein